MSILTTPLVVHDEDDQEIAWRIIATDPRVVVYADQDNDEDGAVKAVSAWLLDVAWVMMVMAKVGPWMTKYGFGVVPLPM